MVDDLVGPESPDAVGVAGARGVDQRDARGGGRQHVGRGEDELGGHTVRGHRQEADDLLADLHRGDPVTEGRDRARDIGAGRVGQRDREGALEPPAADAGVDTVRREVDVWDVAWLGATLAQPGRDDPGWEAICLRLLDTYLAGLSVPT
ncbi:hypothetical protein GCM10027596_19900 [Nocardioides korecus]